MLWPYRSGRMWLAGNGGLRGRGEFVRLRAESFTVTSPTKGLAMRRVLAIAAIFALAAPSLALAQFGGGGNQHGSNGNKGGGRPPARAVAPHPGPPGGHGPVGGGPPRRGPVVGGPIHGPVHGPVGGPVRVGVGGPHAPFLFHGRPFAWHPVRFPRPWVYPPGYAYRLWAVGAVLPPLFWAANSPYFYAGWADMGLPPPDPGFQYVQYGPDLLLVNVATGEVVQVFPGAFS
jgi:hypothetical protein